ncbi:MFS family permease [Microbacterium resistens]|uniref:MFS family permease n=1 Tax=Microbacterium resistens TaxID=156977 RepID=A0ABU1SE96_9MICO|nr:MFS transporter [Microbacterium resistens]MDR6867573.1 MFS family permease [Microbacterium resistens]
MSEIPSAPVAAGPLTQPVASVRAPKRYFVGLFLGQFGLFVALLSPVMVSMQLKVQELAPEDPASLLGAVLPFGAFGAMLANPLAGALSDRTRTRWGRRRPWLVGGVAGLLIGLVLVAFAQDQLSLTLAWLLCQVAANATLAALVASFADNVPEFQRGVGSSVIAIAQNVAILAGTYLAVFLVGNLPVLFIAPGVLAIVLVLVYAFLLRDELPDYELKRFTWLNIIGSFWTNPLKNPDFGFAWWSRFLITLATMMFTTYRLLYMQEHLGLADPAQATAAVAQGVLFYTIALLVSSAVSGWLSDRTGRRKVFVAGSTLLFGVGLVTLAHADTVEVFYLAEVVMGLAYGVYVAVDQALVVDVLPNADRPGKDLGVINIANALPQSLAPAFALIFLGIGVEGSSNYTAMLWAAGGVCLLGALAVLPIKRVR